MGEKHHQANGEKLTNKEYTKELRRPQAELCKLQDCGEGQAPAPRHPEAIQR